MYDILKPKGSGLNKNTVRTTTVNNLFCGLFYDKNVDKVSNTAYKIADNVIDLSEMTSEKDDDTNEKALKNLETLKIGDWDPSKYFSTQHSAEIKSFRAKLKDEVFDNLDRYDFGNTDSDQFTDDDIKFIGGKLKSAIFLSNFPAKDDFHTEVKSSGLDLNNKNELDGFLNGQLENIITSEFVHSQLNEISNEWNKHRHLMQEAGNDKNRFSYNKGKAAVEAKKGKKEVEEKEFQPIQYGAN